MWEGEGYVCVCGVGVGVIAMYVRVHAITEAFSVFQS